MFSKFSKDIDVNGLVLYIVIFLASTIGGVKLIVDGSNAASKHGTDEGLKEIIIGSLLLAFAVFGAAAAYKYRA